MLICDIMIYYYIIMVVYAWMCSRYSCGLLWFSIGALYPHFTQRNIWRFKALLYIYVYLYACVVKSAIQGKYARQEHAKMQPAEVRPKPNTLEQIIKSCQNQGQILRKSYFDFSCWKSIPTPVSKNLHYRAKIPKSQKISLQPWKFER